jgi:hypothetical protein
MRKASYNFETYNGDNAIRVAAEMAEGQVIDTIAQEIGAINGNGAGA